MKIQISYNPNDTGKRDNAMEDMIVQGLTQNNLKHVSFRIPKEKITVFTGVSGSGKSVLCLIPLLPNHRDR